VLCNMSEAEKKDGVLSTSDHLGRPLTIKTIAGKDKLDYQQSITCVKI
jgi:hypothetical protein